MAKEAYMLTLKCLEEDCMAVIRLGRVISAPVLKFGGFSFCPVCGGKAGSTLDSEEDYWEALGNAYEIPPEAVKLIYSIWDSKTDINFATFAKKTWKELQPKESG